MRRRSGIGVLLDAVEYMFAGGCLLAMNFVLMLVFGLLRNLPDILRALRAFLRETVVVGYRLYRPIIERLQPPAARHLGLLIGLNPIRPAATGLFSLLLLLIGLLLLGWRISFVLCVLALLHGAVVGLLWEALEQGDGLRTGERIP